MTNPLLRLKALGQSVWLDDIDRAQLRSGLFGCLIEEDGLSGATGNPTIFEHAIDHGTTYDEQMWQLFAQGMPAQAIYETLAMTDVRQVADLLRPTYDRTAGQDGFVSFEVSPTLADVRYVEELIGPETVNTMPLATIENFRNHDQVRLSIEEQLCDECQQDLWKAGEIVLAGTSTRVDDHSYRLVLLEHEGPQPATFDGYIALPCSSRRPRGPREPHPTADAWFCDRCQRILRPCLA